MGSHSLLQEIFPIQGSNPHLLHCRWIFFYHLSHEGSPKKRYDLHNFVGYGDCERCFATWRCGDGMCLCRGAGERWGERERQGALVNTVMGSPGVSPLACGSVWGALMLCTCLSVVHGGKRPLPPAHTSEAVSGGGWTEGRVNRI